MCNEREDSIQLTSSNNQRLFPNVVHWFPHDLYDHGSRNLMSLLARCTRRFNRRKSLQVLSIIAAVDCSYVIINVEGTSHLFSDQTIVPHGNWNLSVPGGHAAVCCAGCDSCFWLISFISFIKTENFIIMQNKNPRNWKGLSSHQMKKKESSEKECRNYYTEINREGLLCVGCGCERSVL